MSRRRVTATILGVTLFVTLAARASAQAPTEQPEAPPEVPGADVATAPDPAAGLNAETAARFDDLDQLIRIEARKREIAEEAAAAKKATTPVIVADEKGFALKAADSSYVLKLRGLLQVDGRFFFHDDALEANDTFLLRRFRPSLDGTLFSLVDFRFLPELAGTVQILDGYIDVHPRLWLRLRVGKFKTPVGLERLQSDADLPIVERALDQNLSSQRDVGAYVWGEIASGAFQYVAGVVNGTADTASGDTDLDHAKDFIGRIFFQPFASPELRDYGSLGIGLAAQTGNRKGRLPTAVSGLVIPSVPAQTGLAPSFKTSGQNTFFSYLASATDTTGALTTFTNQRTTHLNPQLYYYYDNIGLLAEYLYLWQGVQRGNSTTVLKHQAAHATLTYTLGGREGFDGVTPTAPFDPATGSLGALQISARWSWIKLDPATFGSPGNTAYADPVKSAQSAQAFGGGLGWIPRRTFRFTLDFEQTRFSGGAGAAATAATPGVPAMPAVVANRKNEYVLIARAQVNF